MALNTNRLTNLMVSELINQGMKPNDEFTRKFLWAIASAVVTEIRNNADVYGAVVNSTIQQGRVN